MQVKVKMQARVEHMLKTGALIDCGLLMDQ